MARRRYDGNGQRKDETRIAGGLSNETWSYGYDELGRRKQVILPDGVVRDYLYDLDSNRTEVKENRQYGRELHRRPGPNRRGRPADQRDPWWHTTTYGYTGDGQVSVRPDSLSWDGRGRLSGGTFAGQAVSYEF